jgi:hypothetical protein
MITAIPLLLVSLLPGVPEGAQGPGTAAAGDAAPAATRPARSWNLSVGTGGGGFVEFVDAFAGSAPVGYDDSRREDRFQLNLRADRELGRWLRAGVAYVYDGWTEEYLSGGSVAGTLSNRVHVLMADVTVSWVRSEHLEFYSALAAGGGRWRQVGTGIAASSGGVSSGFAFQLRCAGIAEGSERVRLFVDLGIGFEGLVVGGLLVRL